VGTVVEADRIDFIGISSSIRKEGREGCVQVCVQVEGMPVTDRELAELKRLQEETAAKADGVLDGQ